MTLYLIGNILGRMLVSYVLVLVVVLLINRFNLKLALRRSVAWYSWVAVIALTLFGIGVHVAEHGGLA